MYRYVVFGIYVISFALSFYYLSGLDFARFLRKGHSHKAEGLLFLFSVALAYIVTQFFLGITNL